MTVHSAGGNPWDAFIEDPRNGREMHTRAEQHREDIEYLEQRSLPEPNVRPGVAHRWVRGEMTATGADARNYNQRVREGWVPVRLKDYPEMASLMAVQSSRPNPEGHVSVDGLILCAMPQTRADARTKYFHDKTNEVLRGVNNQFMRETPDYSHLGVQRTDDSTSRSKFGAGAYRE